MTRIWRTEHDSLGAVEVPAEHYWGAQTQRALSNFPAGGPRYRWRRPVLRALGLVKLAGGEANGELGLLDDEAAALITAAAREVAAGSLDGEFPLPIFHSGSGTQTNMNVNEVIAGRANELAGRGRGGRTPIHPNDHVNLSQSSNDVIPTVMHVAIVEQLDAALLPALDQLRASLRSKAAEYADDLLLGRTHLQDATPVTLGQVIGGWAAQLDGARSALVGAGEPLYRLALGGTAVGTGLNADPRFAPLAIAKLAEFTGKPLRPADDRFAALSAHDAIVNASAALRTLAGSLLKIANDVRWYASGPRAGLGELTIPANEPGSSIMPGKINPSQAEALSMVALQVFGNDSAVAIAGSQGNFQLNVYKPLMLHNVVESIELLSGAVTAFEAHCVRGLAANRAVMRRRVDQSLMLATALAPHLGYEQAAAIALAAHRDGTTLREAALASGALTAAQFDTWVRPEHMARPEAGARRPTD